jgi:hypothetical protein
MLDTLTAELPAARPRGHKNPPGPLSPCESCRHSSRCKTESLGCEALVLFMRLAASPARLQYAPRVPSRAAFERAHERPKPKPQRIILQEIPDFDEADFDEEESAEEIGF